MQTDYTAAEVAERLRGIPDPVERAAQAQALVSGAENAQREVGPILRAAVREMRAAKMSHQDVADALGVSKTRARQLAGEAEDPGRRRVAVPAPRTPEPIAS